MVSPLMPPPPVAHSLIIRDENDLLYIYQYVMTEDDRPVIISAEQVDRNWKVKKIKVDDERYAEVLLYLFAPERNLNRPPET